MFLQQKISSENGSSSLIYISNGFPWHLHLITNNHVIPTIEIAKQTKAEFRYEDGRPECFSLDPDAYFVTNEDLDFTIVALSYSASVSVKKKSHLVLAFSDAEPILGEQLGYSWFFFSFYLFYLFSRIYFNLKKYFPMTLTVPFFFFFFFFFFCSLNSFKIFFKSRCLLLSMVSICKATGSHG